MLSLGLDLFSLAVRYRGGGGTPTPAASITSPATYSQPEETARFQQPTASTTGTWSKGAGVNAALFTVDATTGIWTIASGTAEGVYTLPLVFTPTVGSPVSQDVVVTLTTIEATGSLSLNYDADLTGSAGVPLHTLPGWAIYYQPSTSGYDSFGFLRDGSGHLYHSTGNYSNWGKYTALYGTETSAAGMIFTVTLPVSTTGDYRPISFNVCADGWENGILIKLFPRPNGELLVGDRKKRQAGVVTDVTLAGATTGNFRVDGTADIIFEVSEDGNTLTIKCDGTTLTTVGTIDLTGLTLGGRFGFGGIGAFDGTDDDMILHAVQVNKVAIVLTPDIVPHFSNNNAAEYVVDWIGTAPSRLQHRILEDDEVTPVTGWMTGESIVTGAMSGDVTYVASAPAGEEERYVEFRAYNDTGSTATADTPTIFNVPYSASFGYNFRSANYYTPFPILNNWGKFVEISIGFSSIYVPYAGINGIATVQTNTGVALTGTFGDGLSVTSSDSSTGVHVVNVSADQTSGNLRGFYFTVTRQGVSGKIAQEWIDGVEGTGLRTLDMVGANFVLENSDIAMNAVSDALYDKGNFAGAYLPIEDIVDGCVAKHAADPTFKDLWWVVRNDMGDPEVTASLTYIEANLPDAMMLQLELGNEQPWNTAFTAVVRLMCDALRYGWYDGATSTTPMTAIPCVSAGGGDAVNTASPATASGGHVVYNTYGSSHELWRAKQAVPAGTAIAENAYWEKRTDVGSLYDAARRWRSIRHAQIIAIAKTVFGASYAARVTPVVMGQQFSGSPFSNLVIERTFIPGYWDDVKGYGYAFYFYEGTTVAAISRATVTAVQIRDGFYNESIPEVTAHIRQAAIDVLREGKIPCFYEGMTHPDFAAYQNTGVPNYKTQWDALFTSADGQTLMFDLAQVVKANTPGIIMGFDLLGGPPWSVKNTYTDTSNKRLLGWRAGQVA